MHSFVRFTISGLSGAVTSAKLRLYATSATVDGPAVYATATDWSERGITWATRPAPVGAAGDDKGAVPKDTWVEFDVTPLVEGNGVYAFVLIGSSNDPVDMSSREGRRPPQLVVTTAADTTAPSAPAGLAATGVSGNSVSLGWSASSDDVGVAGYNVFVDGALSGTTSSTAYTVSSLACGKAYAVGVQAFDQTGNLSPRTTVSALTPACAPPAATVCSKTLAAGGDVSTFVNSLKPGDVGCLHGGTYTDGTIVTWTSSGTAAAPITLTEYPGEQAEIAGTTLYLDGSYQIARDLTVRDVTAVDGDGIDVSGTGDRVEHNAIRNVARQGILLHTDSANAVIVGNDVRDTGQTGSNQHHGIYVQGNGHLVIDNVFAQMHGGYGIHVYPSSSNVVVAQNTVVGSQTRSGILIDSTGGNITVVNNILVGNAEYGVLNRRCDLGGCLVDHNLAWNNGLGPTSGRAGNTIQANPQFTDSTYHLAGTSPAVNSARSDYSYSPDRDGAPRPQGGGPDLGAYEE